MSRDQLADWLHCLHGGMYDWVIDEIKKELAKISIEPPDYVEPPTSDYHNGWEEGFEVAKNLYPKKTKREWVGLTGTEINHIFAANVGYPERMCRAIEAKLKEKNEH